MRVKRQRNPSGDHEPDPKDELETLVQEKIALATKLGLMSVILPDEESYKHTDEYKRIQDIDKLLWGLFKTN